MATVPGCRVKRSGIGDLVICLADDPRQCPHAQYHAFRWFCLHKNWQKILAQSEAANPV